MLGHLDRAGGAVHAQGEEGEVAQRGDAAGDVGADEGGAELLDGDLDHDGHVPAGVIADIGCEVAFFEDGEGGAQGALDLEDVLRGFEEEDIGAAVEQAADLRGVAGVHGVPVDVAERDEFGARSHGADDEARAVGGGELFTRGAGNFGGGLVQLVYAVHEVLVLHGVQLRVEGIGLDAIGAGGEEVLVDALDDLGAGEQQDLGAVLPAEVVAVEIEVGDVVDGGAHRAVEEEDTAFGFVGESAHGGVRGGGSWGAKVGGKAVERAEAATFQYSSVYPDEAIIWFAGAGASRVGAVG